MKTCHFLLSRTALAVLATTAFTLNTETVLAQQAAGEQSGSAIKEVVVEAKTPVHISSKKVDFAGRTEETLTLERRVSYADLDLSRPGDVLLLKKRIEDNAKQACSDLYSLYPPTNSDEIPAGCIKHATESANDGLKMAIASAKK